MISALSRIPLLGLSAVLICATGCTQKESFRTENPQVVKVDELPNDFKLPANIWNIVEKTEDETKSDKVSSTDIFYSSVKVFLTEKNADILQSPSYLIELPRGGGQVDLAQYLSGHQGTFYVGFELPEEFQEGVNFKVFYISSARKRKLDGRIYGSGCNQYMEITSKFLEMMKKEGLKVNTTRERHITVLAGHYVFSVIKNNRIYITQVTVTDSRYKNLLCGAL